LAVVGAPVYVSAFTGAVVEGGMAAVVFTRAANLYPEDLV
jgi:hypothetical protein